MKLIVKTLASLLLLVFSGYPETLAQSIITEQEPVIGIVEHEGRILPGDVFVTDETGKLVNLKKSIDKPTVITFVYYRCPGLCSPLLDGLAEAIDSAELKIGTDYQVFTISFDPTEGTALARQKKANYLSQMKNKNAAAGWHFFTADSSNIASLTSATGFKFKRAGKDFLHAATLILVDPRSKIIRYLNGTRYNASDFKLAILDATPTKNAKISDKIKAYFYQFDPVSKQYQKNFMKIAGLIFIFLSLGVFLYLLVKPFPKKGIHTKK